MEWINKLLEELEMDALHMPVSNADHRKQRGRTAPNRALSTATNQTYNQRIQITIITIEY